MKKSGAWFSYNDMRIGQGRENAKKFIGENPDIQAELEKKIMENAQQIDYSSSDDDDETAESASAVPTEEMSFTEAAELESKKKASAKSGAKKAKPKKSVIVDADDDFEEFSIDEISGEE